MDILRIITAGNVDDGKSTLIGRLLHDTGNIKVDVLKSLEGDNAVINLAQVTDGLRSERAQGITIDVAYKYFTTTNRKYILTDAPGHFQYTKNLVTGASNVDAIIILIDACNGITEQTKRHSLVASFLKIPNVLVVVNKMDAIGYSRDIFEDITGAFKILAGKLRLSGVTFIPASALCGDNVISNSRDMNWYTGETILQYLEHCMPQNLSQLPFRFPVQMVYRRNDKSVLMGKVASGIARVGELINTSQDNKTNAIQHVTVAGRSSMEASSGYSVALYTSSSIELDHGQLIYKQDEPTPTLSDSIDIILCWLEDTPLTENTEYHIQLNGVRKRCTVTRLISKYNVGRLDLVESDGTLLMNEIGTATIRIETVVAFDSYGENKATGRGILIDPLTHNTCAAFTID